VRSGRHDGQGGTSPPCRDRGMSELESVVDESPPGGTEAILLVEDDQTIRLAAQQLLSKVGYRVFTPSTASKDSTRSAPTVRTFSS